MQIGAGAVIVCSCLPAWAGDPVASPILRELLPSKIEAAINRRQFAVTGASHLHEGRMTLPSGRALRSF